MKQKVESIIDALVYSMSGIKYLLKERSFVQELMLGCVIFMVEIFRSSTFAMRLYLFSAYVIVLIFEAINTSIELSVDRISTDKHELSKRSKDISSAAVFIALTHLGIVWLFSWFA